MRMESIKKVLRPFEMFPLKQHRRRHVDLDHMRRTALLLSFFSFAAKSGLWSGL